MPSRLSEICQHIFTSPFLSQLPILMNVVILHMVQTQLLTLLATASCNLHLGFLPDRPDAFSHFFHLASAPQHRPEWESLDSQDTIQSIYVCS